MIFDTIIEENRPSPEFYISEISHDLWFDVIYINDMIHGMIHIQQIMCISSQIVGNSFITC
jgi:hypothetical protein